MDENILDAGISHNEEYEQKTIDDTYIERAKFWAYMGGIGGIIMGHKVAYGSRFINNKVQYVYDHYSREQAKKIQKIGLLIWIPLYIALIIGYVIFVFSIVGIA